MIINCKTAVHNKNEPYIKDNTEDYLNPDSKSKFVYNYLHYTILCRYQLNLLCFFLYVSIY